MLFFYLSIINSEKEENKFELIYNKYKSLMFYVSNNILNDEFLAEDAVHAAFLKIINNLHKIDDVNCHKTKAFVVIVVENVAKTMYMKRKKDNTISFDTSKHEVAETSLDLEHLIDEMSIEGIVKKLSHLPQSDNDILTFRYLNELSNKEIAKLLNIKEAAVRKRLERARQRLASLLSEEE